MENQFQIHPSKKAPGHRVLLIPHDFTLRSMHALIRAFDQELEQGHSVLLVDFGLVEDMAISSIEPFVDEIRRTKDRGLYLGIFGLQSKIRKKVRASGVRDDLDASDTEETAALNLVAAGTDKAAQILPPAEAVAARVEFKVRIPSRHGFVHAMRPFLQGALREAGFTKKFADDIELAFDEAVVNIIEHTFHNSPDREIDITVDIDIDMVRLIIEDEGESYDPTLAPKVDMKEYLKSKKVGGLGLHLIRMLMDHIEYHPGAGGGNVLTLEKWAS